MQIWVLLPVEEPSESDFHHEEHEVNEEEGNFSLSTETFTINKLRA